MGNGTSAAGLELIPLASLKRHNGLGEQANAIDTTHRIRGARTTAVSTFKRKRVPIQTMEETHMGSRNDTIKTSKKKTPPTTTTTTTETPTVRSLKLTDSSRCEYS